MSLTHSTAIQVIKERIFTLVENLTYWEDTLERKVYGDKQIPLVKLAVTQANHELKELHFTLDILGQT